MNCSTKDNYYTIAISISSIYIFNTFQIFLCFFLIYKILKRYIDNKIPDLLQDFPEFLFSFCNTHRYLYKKELDTNLKKVLVIVGFQPAKNDEIKMGKAIKNVEELIKTKYYFYGTICFINIFSNMYIDKEDFMNTDSDELCSKKNIDIFRKLLDEPSLDCDVIFAWGKCKYWSWDIVNPEIKKILNNCSKKKLCFGKNRDNEPKSIGALQYIAKDKRCLEEYNFNN